MIKRGSEGATKRRSDKMKGPRSVGVRERFSEETKERGSEGTSQGAREQGSER